MNTQNPAITPGGNLTGRSTRNFSSEAVEAMQADKPTATGLKHDHAKPRFDLLDPVWLHGVADVLTFGAIKYAPDNWRGGIVYSRILGALMRHTNAIARGEVHDPETGLRHTDHASCCLMFLSRFQADSRTDLDDLGGKTVANPA